MSNFAKIVNNVVTEVIVADQPFVDTLNGEWVKTSENGNFPGIGYNYDPINNAFYAPQPYLSWTLNQANYQWNPPIPYPNDDKSYIWDESNKLWEEIPNGL
jgi:hypothetical protein